MVTVLYYKSIRIPNSTTIRYLLYSTPIIILWVLIVGGQYGVGTDYFSYMSYFTHTDLSYFIDRKDIVFANFVKLCQNNGISGQGIFFVLAFIWVLILLLIFDFLSGGRTKYLGLLFFLFIVYSTAFNNQMNGLRQYTSIYILTFSLCLYFQKKYILCALLVALAILNHRSSLIVALIFVFYYFLKAEWFKKSWLYIIVAIGFISSIVLNVVKITPFLDYLRAEEMFDEYTIYYNNLQLESSDFFEKITKYIYIPLYFWGISQLDNMKLSSMGRKLFVIGILSYSIKMAILSLPYIYRLGSYFEVLMCLPLFYLLIYYKRNILAYLFIVLYLLLPYIYKVTIGAQAEYLFDSYFLH